MSMHRDSFVVAVKTAEGKVLREDNSGNIPVVYLPFDSDYKLLLKNLHKRRAVATIMIDGQDIGAGHRFVVDWGRTIEIERFMLDGNMQAGRKLRFVKADDKRVESSEFGGNGFIKVTWQFEKAWEPKTTTTIIHEHHYDGYYYWPVYTRPWRYVPYTPWWGPTYCSSASNDDANQNVSYSGYAAPVGTSGKSPEGGAKIQAMNMMAQQRGATVEGEASDQQFSTSVIGELETETHELTFQILAPVVEEGKVAKPVTVQDTKNRFCADCGQKMPYNAKFCSNCGQAL